MHGFLKIRDLLCFASCLVNVKDAGGVRHADPRHLNRNVYAHRLCFIRKICMPSSICVVLPRGEQAQRRRSLGAHQGEPASGRKEKSPPRRWACQRKGAAPCSAFAYTVDHVK